MPRRFQAGRPNPDAIILGLCPPQTPGLHFLCADKGNEAKENRPTEQRLFSNALGSLPPRILRQPVFGVAADSALLSARKRRDLATGSFHGQLGGPQRRYGHPGPPAKRRDRATGSLPAPLGGPSAIRLKHRKP